MKKITACILLLILPLCACAKSEAAIKAENLIEQIGEVSLADGDIIAKAEAAVSALTDFERGRLGSLSLLSEARTKYDELAVLEEADLIGGVIAAIGYVTLESGEALAAARKQYEAASDEIKNRVANLTVLESAEERYALLRAEKVAALIAEIGNAPFENTDKIVEARREFDALAPEEAALVANYDLLEAALTQSGIID